MTLYTQPGTNQREASDSIFSMWAGSIDPSGEIAFTRLARIEEGVRRCLCITHAEQKTRQSLPPGLSISEPLRKEPPIAGDGPLCTCEWNTREGLYNATLMDGNGAPQTIRIITPAEMPNGQFGFDDMAVDRKAGYT